MITHYLLQIVMLGGLILAVVLGARFGTHIDVYRNETRPAPVLESESKDAEDAA